MTFSEQYLTEAHKHSSGHRAEIKASEVCGCFYCGNIFPPSEIDMWVNNGTYATCPKCSIDSVLGSASGLPVANKTFLDAMHERWFERTEYVEN